jgi:competence protein ComEA
LRKILRQAIPMKNWRIVVISLICGLLAAGTVWLVSRPPRGQMVRLLPPPTLAPLVVHVSGAVARPGVYNLPAGSRVKDAVLAAGDVLPDANPDAINLAAPLEDGAKIEVPRLNPPVATAAPTPMQSSGQASAGPININLATQEELESLPGIGPVIAERIITYREENGPFSKPEAIQNVSGIGPATFDRIRDLITVAAIP